MGNGYRIESAPLEIIIIGGGIGGLCLAQGLKQAGIPFRVFERDVTSASRLQGYRLNIEPVGARALKDCLPPTLWAALIASAGDAGQGMGIFDERLRLLMRENASSATDPVDATHAVSRRKLRQLLLSGLEAEVAFGKEFTRYETLANGRVRAWFADGSSATGDLLVAADGVNSRVRRQFLPNARVELANGVGIGGKLPLTEGTEAWLPKELLKGKSMIMPRQDFLFTAAYRRRTPAVVSAIGRDDEDPDYLMWAFVTQGSGGLSKASEAGGVHLREQVLDRISNWSPDLCRIVAETPDASVELFDFRAAEPVQPWISASITLVGDAIHAMPPVGGIGGNAALADASALLRALVTVAQGKTSLRLALSSYEQAMLKRGFDSVRQSRRYLQLAIAPSRLVRATARGFFRMCEAVPPLKRVVFD